MKRVLFTLTPHSIIDVITNSSSELFVGKSQNKQEIKDLISEVYPNYLDEYEEVQSISELSNDELYTYISYHYHTWSNSKQSLENKLIPGFTINEMYEKTKRNDYSLKDNFVCDENREKIIKGIDPNNDIYFLFSLNENPIWEYQEKLEEIMTRYHLG
jgi:hypothetical protein